MACRHSHCWAIGGVLLWCPDCGAIRQNHPKSKGWIYPQGQEKALKRSDKIWVKHLG